MYFPPGVPLSVLLMGRGVGGGGVQGVFLGLKFWAKRIFDSFGSLDTVIFWVMKKTQSGTFSGITFFTSSNQQWCGILGGMLKKLGFFLGR